jgi:hypothetical protein
MKVPTTADGVDGLIAMEGFDDIEIVFDATSARAHVANAGELAPYGKKLVELTPAAIGSYVVPPVNLDQHLAEDATNMNMVTCGGQATIPMVAAIARVTPCLRRDRRLHRVEVGRAGHAGQRRGVHRDDRARHRGGRRRRPGQGDRSCSTPLSRR